MTLYDKVKSRAVELNKSIAKVEAEAGVANGTIGGWKNGKPYAETLKKVADVLQIPMEELLN